MSHKTMPSEQAVKIDIDQAINYFEKGIRVMCYVEPSDLGLVHVSDLPGVKPQKETNGSHDISFPKSCMLRVTTRLVPDRYKGTRRVHAVALICAFDKMAVNDVAKRLDIVRLAAAETKEKQNSVSSTMSVMCKEGIFNRVG